MTTSPVSSDKASLRRHFRQRRRSLTAVHREQASLAAAARLTDLPGWDAMHTVGLYLAADAELDPTPIAQVCRDAGRTLLLPRLRDKALEFAPWEACDELPANRFDIPEPPAHRAAVSLAAIDLLFLPLVAWDRRGTRLGMGGGFYDRTLGQAAARPVLVGLGYACQEAQELPRQHWDQRLHWLLNEDELIDCRSS